MVNHYPTTGSTKTGSPWQLTPSQIAQFDRDGFVLLPNRLPAELLTLLQQKAQQLQTDGHLKLKTNCHGPDYLFTYSYLQPFLNRLLHFHLHSGIATLPLLACPQVLAIAESLCGRDFIPTVDMMVLKYQRNNAPIPWHQDLIYQFDRYRVATVGIYLDDASAGDGALKILPSSQQQKHDICAIVAQPQPQAVEIPVKAGDILVHNPMIVHCSDNISNAAQRRTLYYEFRPLAQAIAEETWPPKLLNRRLDLLATSLAYYGQHYPLADQFDWQLSAQWGVHSPVSDLSSLYLDPIPFNTVNYCQSKA